MDLKIWSKTFTSARVQQLVDLWRVENFAVKSKTVGMQQAARCFGSDDLVPDGCSN